MVNNSLLLFKTMILWKFDSLCKSYATIDKTVVHTENYGTSIYEGKTQITKNYEILSYKRKKKLPRFPKQFLKKYIALER